jgi:hypothetical protein
VREPFNTISRFTLLLVVSAPMIAAQSRAVVWGSDPGCGFHTSNFSAEEKLVCSLIETPRGQVSGIAVGGIGLAVAFAEDGDHILVATSITNITNQVVTFDSDLWGAAHFRTKEDLSSKTPPILAETSIPSRDLIRSMAAGKNLEDSLGQFMSDITMTTEEREMKRLDGTKYKVAVIVPDKNAKVAEVGKSENRSVSLTQEQMKIRETALTAKSVQPGNTIKGLVYFRRVKKAAFVVFSFSIDDTLYIFRLPRQAT